MSTHAFEYVRYGQAAGTTRHPSRAALQTRPLIQRLLIRSWEYRRPIRITFLAIRLLVVAWLLVLGAILANGGTDWSWGVVLPVAVAALALSRWIFITAAKGWPVVEG